MERIIAGVQAFQRDIHPKYRELFVRLAREQSPQALFITCSDSRVDPALLTQSRPGDLFMLRNAGNLVPPCDDGGGGEAATIEFAVVAVGVPNIIVCGHSDCRAIASLLQPGMLRQTPRLGHWLRHAAMVRDALNRTGGVDGPNVLQRAIEANVLLQIGHLRTHPSVANALAAGRLALHGWIYDIPSGEILTYDETWQQFVPLT